MATTLLVTVGSTQFQQLTDAVLAPAVLDALPQLGVSDLVVQLGSAQLPAAVQLQLSSAGEGAFTHGGDGSKLRVDVLRYTKGAREMDALIARAGVVVSHAGSGTILEVLRKSPPPRLLVVPNPALMDDHQRELAGALAAGKYLTVSDVDSLLDGLRRVLTVDDTTPAPKRFPAPQPERFAAILDKTAGF